MTKCFLFLAFLIAVSTTGFGAPTAEFQTTEIVKKEGPSVVHLWAPWCSNCQAELKSGGWTKTIADHPETRFVFVSVWNAGEAGVAMLKKFGIGDQPNVTIVADAGPRSGPDKIKRFLDLPVTWIPTTWVFQSGELRYALNYGEVRFDMLQQMLTDSTDEWSHKGEVPAIP
jgi:thiol-disulfide isomerase/thioredoxin